MNDEEVVSDDQIVEGLRGGNTDAGCRHLYSKYGLRLSRLIVGIVRDEHLAEDVFQEAWMTVLLAIHSFDEKRSFEPWLCMIARNKARDKLRRMRSDILRKADDLVVQGERYASSRDADPADREEFEKQKDLLSEAIHGLPDAQREVMELRRRGLDIRVIADHLGKTPSNVRATATHARNTLKRTLGGTSND